MQLSNRKRVFSDKRLDKKSEELIESIAENQSVNISKISSSRSQQISFYRFLNNEKVSEEKIIKTITGLCRQKAADQASSSSSNNHYLALSDSTDMNFQRHIGRLNSNKLTGSFGPINDYQTGFYVHPVLVIDADNERSLGFSSVHIWSRDCLMGNKTERDYKRVPIEQKESYKWIFTSEETKKLLPEVQMVTIVEDREGDIFEEWARVPDQRTHLLVRASQNRLIAEGKLYQYMESQQVIAKMEVEVKGDIRKQRIKRRARVEIRIAEITIKRPDKLSANNSYPSQLTLRAIEVREIEGSVPEGEEPILWRLLTTHSLESIEKVINVIKWYTKRWYIEQLFRILKKEGMKVEQIELESAQAIRKLVIFAMISSLKVMMLLLASKNETQQRIEDEFTQEEIQCLEVLSSKYEGKTDKQKNPYPKDSLQWASWIIARLGGWKGYQSQHKAGPITFITGLEKFQHLMLGWQMVKFKYQLVYTP